MNEWICCFETQKTNHRLLTGVNFAFLLQLKTGICCFNLLGNYVLFSMEFVKGRDRILCSLYFLWHLVHNINSLRIFFKNPNF